MKELPLIYKIFPSNTPLHDAIGTAGNKNKEVVKLLLEKGANSDTVDFCE
ncbi:ankyrin repeat domain-containing protein [Wolbachia endosymbiont of Mansonella ozzardi]|nr:ankyrin repeat domain-containing protein [Wolbachia endosymbiont of Mansonella ozzardi]